MTTPSQPLSRRSLFGLVAGLWGVKSVVQIPTTGTTLRLIEMQQIHDTLRHEAYYSVLRKAYERMEAGRACWLVSAPADPSVPCEWIPLSAHPLEGGEG